MAMTMVELDNRRRTALGKLGHKDHTRYLVEEYEDGSMMWTPAAVVPISNLGAELRAASQRVKAGGGRKLADVLKELDDD